MHYLEIPKIKEKPDTEILRWLYYLRHAGEEDENVEELLKKDRAIYQADERYKKFLADERARIAYLERSMFLHDQATLLGTERRQARAEGLEEGRRKGLEDGQKQGLAEGREEGRKEGREEGQRKGEHTKAVETARKLAGRGMSVSEIAEITGLSEKEIRRYYIID